MNSYASRDKVEKSHEAYQRRRALDKYDGKVEKHFPLKEFRKCADSLAAVLNQATFDAEDIGDIVRVALWKSNAAPG
jgi:hypothetical protein